MKKFLRYVLFVLAGLLGLLLVLWLGYEGVNAFGNSQLEGQLTAKPTLTEGGHSFRDLNANGRLDPYEDSRQPVQARVEDLLSQMTLAEKAGLMWHPPIGMGMDGSVLNRPSPEALFVGSTLDLVVGKEIRHFNLFKIAEPVAHATWYNALQKMAEQDRLGIPVTISTDPRHAAGNFIAGGLLDSRFSKWPEPLGMAAIGDSLAMLEFARIASQEYRAVGMRTALHPMADLATEPRWARTNGTFGEDPALAAKMTAAYVLGFQGDSLGPASVACMTKHWPGGGPQKDGEDAHFRYGKDQVYPGGQFELHMKVFEAAFDAGTAMIMPYYGVPNGQPGMEEVGFNFNRYVITDLLRQRYGFEGIVCTDWGVLKDSGVPFVIEVPAKNYGVEDLTLQGRILKAIEAGVDQFGGDQLPEEIVALVESGQLSEARVDESARRLLRAKFQMGLFDNPYVEVAEVSRVVANAEFVAKGKAAQRRSMVLLKNDSLQAGQPLLPLAAGKKIYVEGLDAATLAGLANVVADPAEADLAILHLATPWDPRDSDFIESMFHQGRLHFKPAERDRLLAIMAQVPTVLVMKVDRPPVIPELAAASRGLLAHFGVEEDAVVDVVFGKAAPGGRLPVEFPSSPEALTQQKEDVPYDSPNPLFPFGAGLRYGDTEQSQTGTPGN